MAIVQMKRIALLAVRSDEKKLLRAMQKLGCVEISPATAEDAEAYGRADSGALQALDRNLGRMSWLIGKLNRWNPQKAPFMGNKPAADPQEQAWVEDHEADILAMLDQGEELERLSGEYAGQLMRLQARYDQLSEWETLDIPMEDLKSDRSIAQFVGSVESAAMNRLRAEIEPLPAVLSEINRVRENTNLWVAAHTSAAEQVSSLLKDAGFTPAKLGEHGTVREQLSALRGEMDTVTGSQAGLDTAWQELARQLTRCKIWFDLKTVERERLECADRLIGTEAVFLMRGWVPAQQAEAVESRLRTLSPTCSVEITDPQEGDTPPVALKNSRLATPFETIVEGYALPAYGALDPTAAMGPFYAMLFGMMLSDAGYGLLMAIAIPLLIRIKQPAKKNQKLLWVLFFSAIATVVAGAIYDTWFGFNPMKDLLHMKPLLDPINDPMPVMIVCLAVGVIHLFAGLGCGIYQNIRRGKPLDAVYDQVSWMLVVTGLILLVLGGTAAQIGTWLAIAGVAIILLFAGREKKNPFSRLISGLGALYGATSWISDILSYMRLFGMGLATGVIGMVINLLVGMVFPTSIDGVLSVLRILIGSVLFAGAHTFNLGINALGAYVHSCRLQYIEFFGKFYEEGGMPFRPLSVSTRYVELSDAR